MLVPEVIATSKYVQNLLAARSPVHKHQHGVFFGGVVVQRFDAPRGKGAAVGQDQRGKFLGADLEFFQAFGQGGVVFQDANLLAVGSVQTDARYLGRGLKRQDERRFGLVEFRVVGAGLRRYRTGLAAVKGYRINFSLGGRYGRGLVVNGSFGVRSVVGGHFGFGVCQGFALFAVGRDGKQLIVAVGLAGPDQGTVGQYFPIIRDIHIGHIFFFQPQLRLLVQALLEELKVVLEAVQNQKRQFIFRSPLHARQVFVVDPVGHFGRGLGGQAVHVQGYLGIGLTGLGVLEFLLGGVQIFAVHVHAESGNVRFVEPQKGQVFAAGRPPQSHVEAEFLLVDPIRSSVQDAVALSICGDSLSVARGDLQHPNVVVLHVRHPLAVGRQLGVLNRFWADGNKRPICQPEQAGFGLVGMAVNGFDAGFQKHGFLVRAERIALDVKRLFVCGFNLFGGHQNAFTGPCGVVELFNLGTVLAAREAGVVGAVGHRAQAADGFGAKRVDAPNVVQRYGTRILRVGRCGCRRFVLIRTASERFCLRHGAEGGCGKQAGPKERGNRSAVHTFAFNEGCRRY